MSEETLKIKTGRPTKYKPEYVELAYNYCLLGATDARLAEFFNVDESTINNWKIDFPEFLESLTRGKYEADARVANSLFMKATGYEHQSVKIFNDNGTPMIVDYVERYAPDTTAAIFWLKNRQPAMWRDKQEIDHSSTDGTMTPKPAIDATQLSTDALAEILALKNADRS